MKLRSFVIASLVAITAAGCGNVRVSVQCKTTDTEVQCTVAETEGKQEVEVCWDFTIKCGNGAIVKAPHSCQKVKDKASTQFSIPNAKLDGLDKCGGTGPTATVSNLTIDGKESSE